MTAYEIERLVVRLLGDSSDYRRMLTDAEAATEAFRRRQQFQDERQRLREEQLARAHAIRMAQLAGNPAAQAAAQARFNEQIRRMRETVDLRARQAEQEFAARLAAQQMKDLEERALMLGRAAKLAFAALSFYSVKTFADIGHEMIKAKVVIGDVTDAQFALMNSSVMAFSAQTIQGPSELAQILQILGSAGKNAEQSMALMPVVAKFATAGFMSTKDAANSLVDIQSALGQSFKDSSAEAANMAHIADVLAKANQIANASTEQFAQALTNHAAAALRIVGKDLEEGTAVLAAYAKQGIKGQVAGSDLSRVVRLLGQSAEKSADAHKRLGFQVFDATGRMRPFADIIQNLEQITGGMSDRMRLVTLHALGFEARIQHAILPLIGMSNEIRNFEAQLRNAGGTMDQMNKEILTSFKSQLIMVKNELIGTAASLGEGLAPAVGVMAGFLKTSAELWRSLPAPIRDSAAAAAGLIVAMTALRLAGQGAAMLFAGTFVKGMFSARLAVAALGAALAVGLVRDIEDAERKAAGLDEAFSKLDKNAKELQERRSKQQEDVFAKARNMGPADARNFLQQQLNQARLNLAGMRSTKQAAIDSFYAQKDEMTAVEKSARGLLGLVDARIMDNAEMELAKKNITNANAAIGQQEQYIQRLQAAVNDFSKGIRKDLNEADQEVLKFTDKTNLEAQVLGVTGKAAEVYKEQLSGANAETLAGGYAAASFYDRAKRMVDLKEEFKKFTESLTDAALAIGTTSDEAKLIGMISKGLSEEERRSAQTLIDQKVALEKRNKLIEEGQKLTEHHLDAQEGFKLRMKELNQMLEMGAVSQNIYDKAVDEATQKLEKQAAALHKNEAALYGSAQAALHEAENQARLNDIVNQGLAAGRAGRKYLPGNREPIPFMPREFEPYPGPSFTDADRLLIQLAPRLAAEAVKAATLQRELDKGRLGYREVNAGTAAGAAELGGEAGAAGAMVAQDKLLHGEIRTPIMEDLTKVGNAFLKGILDAINNKAGGDVLFPALLAE